MKFVIFLSPASHRTGGVNWTEQDRTVERLKCLATLDWKFVSLWQAAGSVLLAVSVILAIMEIGRIAGHVMP